MSISRNIENYLNSFLEPEYRENYLPQYLYQKRIQAIYALFIQILSSFAGLSFFFLRRVPLYLIVNIISITLTIIGLIGVLKIEKWYIVGHALVTTSVLGTFFLFSILEAVLKRESDENIDNHMPERSIMFLMSLPYLVDFFSGCFTFYFVNLLMKFQNKNNEIGDDNREQLLERMRKSNKLCVICYSEIRNATFYKCGHKITCMKCASILKTQNKPMKCPFCREPVLDVIKSFED